MSEGLPPASTDNTIGGTISDDQSQPRLSWISQFIAKPGHQGNTGGKNVNSNDVLIIHNVHYDADYDEIYSKFSPYREILRMRTTADKDCNTIYIFFDEPAAADEAYNDVLANYPVASPKLRDSKVVQTCPTDWYPVTVAPIMIRDSPTLRYHVAVLDVNDANKLKARAHILHTMGNFPTGHIKNYGRNLLLESDDPCQIRRLTNFKRKEGCNITSITPHKTFNTSRGVVYSRDLYEYTEEEILLLCPLNVMRVKKLKGNNHCILFTFTDLRTPDHIIILETRIKVKNYHNRPTQCHRCYEFGHVQNGCHGESQRCYICADYHDEHICEASPRCLHCLGAHYSNSRNCDKYKFEQEIVANAEDQKISFGAARSHLMTINSVVGSTFYEVVKREKHGNRQRRSRGSHAGVTLVMTLGAKF